MTTHKRILNELLELVHISNKIEISTPQQQEQQQKQSKYQPQLIITLSDNTLAPKYKSIQFEIPKSYPFAAPQILINNRYFTQSIPHVELSDYRSKIKKPLPFTTGKCLHCNFIVKDAWSPALGLKEILKEINNVQKTQRLIQEYILLKYISSQKELPNEITQIIHEFL